MSNITCEICDEWIADCNCEVLRLYAGLKKCVCQYIAELENPVSDLSMRNIHRNEMRRFITEIDIENSKGY